MKSDIRAPNEPKFCAKFSGGDDFLIKIQFPGEICNFQNQDFNFCKISLTKFGILFYDVLDVLRTDLNVMHIFRMLRPSSFWSTIDFFEFTNKIMRKFEICETLICFFHTFLKLF